MNNKEISEIFEYFNLKKINYFVLRDYNTIERIYNSKDIDLYLSKKDLIIVDNYLLKNHWNKQINNTNKYPHIQYVKIINNKLFK